MIEIFKILFYSMSLLFIWCELHHINNKERLYSRRNNQIEIVDYLFYIIKIVYLFWLMVGFFSNFNSIFTAIITISIIKFPLLLTKSDKLLTFYDYLSTIVSIILLSWIFFGNLILR
jgi:fatty acid desaturase